MRKSYWSFWGGETLGTKNYFCTRYKNFVPGTKIFKIN
jgi:hypothetical protein